MGSAGNEGAAPPAPTGEGASGEGAQGLLLPGGGGSGEGGSGGKPALRPRKSALFYPSSTLAAHSNQKPFSKSAAKRESVLALGSIGHLQHLFSKQGIASKQRPQMAGNLTLAIGHAGESALQQLQDSPPSSPTLAGGRADALTALEGGGGDGSSSSAHSPPNATSSQQPILVLPPSPTPPKNKRLPYPDVQRPTDVDPEALLPDVIQALDETCQQWDLIGLIKSSHRPAPSDAGHSSYHRHSTFSEPLSTSSTTSSMQAPAMERTGSLGADHAVDILDLIKNTTKTIRRVRAYLLAVPAEVLASRLAERAGMPLTQMEAAALAPRTQKKNAFRRMSSYSQLPRAEPRASITGSSFGPAPSAPSAASAASAAALASASSSTTMSSMAGSSSAASVAHSSSSHHASPVKQRRSTREASESDARSSTGHGQESSAGGASFTSPTNSPSKIKVLDDPLAVIRKSALDVLGMLRELEETYRLPRDDPAYQTAAAGSVLGGQRRASALVDLEPSGSSLGHSAGGSASGSPTKVRAFSSDVVSVTASSSSLAGAVLGGDSTVFGDQTLTGPSAPAADTSLLLGEGESGYLYRTDVRADALQDERGTVRKYVDTVDYVISAVLNDRRGSVGGGMGRSRSRLGNGSEHGSSRSSSALGFVAPGGAGPFGSVGSGAGAVGARLDEEEEGGRMEDLDSDDEDGLGLGGRLAWNWPGRIPGGLKQRLLILLDELLTADLRPHLRSKGADSTAVLNTLTDGHLLCLAYNAALRRSRRPWGFLREEDIHPLVGSTSTAEAGKWTFRKIDNLRNWAAALRLRYSISPDELAVVDMDKDWAEQNQLQQQQQILANGGGEEEEGSTTLTATTPPPNKVRFDPRLIARTEEGWETALSALIARWLKALMDEEVLVT
ncbi:hypothetical protein OC842_003241 [Tilletia horrida]|uniref:Uncharacterized protein n=1 Tax=Tilletia horrida TaxID=155126 RepID=A0AAN6GBS1_9BASI|nr:hypothetical protein OC842_003241 [Tilletia horrida]